ncbi:MAG: DNA/RNA non-specific endonuclease [Prevotella sp.]|nr:DNA/RNA non-specific endonuclease [Prevotella sp.]
MAAAMVFVSCGSSNDDLVPAEREKKTKNINANPTTVREYARLEVPRIKGTDDNLVIIHHVDNEVNFMVEWDCLKKSQRWTCYTLHKGNSQKNVSRYEGNPQYPNDPDLPSAYYFSSDPYYGSGYDHGHILPSYDRLNNSKANFQTFYLTNMQPQRNVFNAGLWLKMENIVSRTWNQNSFRDTLYICKGGTIDEAINILRTTNKGLIVPKYFFMAVLCKNSQGYKAIGLWTEHYETDHSNDNLIDYVVSIDQLERLTGIDFFCNLPDDIEEATEKVVYPSAWSLR